MVLIYRNVGKYFVWLWTTQITFQRCFVTIQPSVCVKNCLYQMSALHIYTEKAEMHDERRNTKTEHNTKGGKGHTGTAMETSRESEETNANIWLTLLHSEKLIKYLKAHEKRFWKKDTTCQRGRVISLFIGVYGPFVDAVALPHPKTVARLSSLKVVFIINLAT